MNLTCLNNVILQYLYTFNVQKNAIATGNNHSVSIANIWVHYSIYHCRWLKCFITKSFTKSTAKDRCFLNGISHHYTSVYKSIVFEEAVRLYRLNERNYDYL